MKALISWFTDRTGINAGYRWLADTPVPGGACWCKVWSAIVLFLFCVQAITGFVLWVYYSPSAQTAWESVYFVQYQVLGGWLLRGIHHFTAHVLLAVLILFLVQSIFTRAGRAPRELVFWVIVGLGLCALASVLTGDLLAWTQNGYASTKTRTGFLTMLPFVGESLLKIAIGGPGPALGTHTLTRFFALHVGVFGAAFGGLALLYIILSHRAAVAAAAAGDRPAEPYWPNQAWRGAVVCVGVMAVVLLLTLCHGGAPLGSPADTDPANAYNAARPEWFLVGVYEFSHWFAGQWGIIPIFIVPGLLVCIALLMPFAARYALGHLLNMIFTGLLLIALVALTWVSYAKDAANKEHQAAIAAENAQAVRVCVLAQHEGIPGSGALTLLRNDPKTQGPRLFAQHCASCHAHMPADAAAGQGIESSAPTAPNLAGFARRAWIAGLLDPEKISGPEYFGNNEKFRGSKMAGFVKDTLADLDADEKKDVAKLVMALSAEAKLPAQQELDAQDAKSIEEGRKLLADDFGCTDCHKFHDKGSLGSAPDLTGYGSAAWTRGILRNPGEKNYYGKNNDRMPAYAPSATDPAQNLLNAREIDMLTNWLRGEWYEPQGKADAATAPATK